MSLEASGARIVRIETRLNLTDSPESGSKVERGVFVLKLVVFEVTEHGCEEKTGDND
jgi:hypothetical protein